MEVGYIFMGIAIFLVSIVFVITLLFMLGLSYIHLLQNDEND
tara:strand:+ start:69 stop:194 length:126 start_codon:yes stop_codon:yes gene_type:complete